jgi:type I restriction enzyme M protein
MTHTASALIQRVWNYAHVLRDEGLGFLEYTEQITYLLFLKLVWEQRGASSALEIPARYTWGKLRSIPDNLELKTRYVQALKNLSKKPGLLGLIFTKPQSKIEDPAKLRHLINMIDEEDWSSLDVDVKGEIYESLLARNSEDVRGGAGQYFTPRPLVRAIMEVMRPTPGMIICDPASGTGGFLLAAYERLRNLVNDSTEEEFLRSKALRGTDIVPNVARLCAMNLYLHGIGDDPDHPPIKIGDSLAHEPEEKVDMVVTNPPFGKKSSITIISDGGKIDKDDIAYARSDFWATTSNKQLNFVQHVYSMLKEGGRAGMVVPDNVLFEGGAGERIRRQMLNHAEVHTLLRLPTGIWYSPGVKANVLFFDKRRTTKAPETRELWVYDLRSHQSFTLRRNPIGPDDLKDFIHCYCADDRARREETSHFRRFKYSDIIARDKANLDIQWQDETMNAAQGETPQALMKEILEDLGEAMREFAAAEREIRE